jgi:DNA (cytosine-5)-methyltransferase 1
LGNAVSVAVINWIAKRINMQFNNIETLFDPESNEVLFLRESMDRWPGLRSSKTITQKLSVVKESYEKIFWPRAGILWKDNFIANKTSTSICNPIHSDLIDIIERDKPDSRYFLSPNAAEGILRRVDSQKRQLFPHLRKALEQLSGRISYGSPHEDRDGEIQLQTELSLLEVMECV